MSEIITKLIIRLLGFFQDETSPPNTTNSHTLTPISELPKTTPKTPTPKTPTPKLTPKSTLTKFCPGCNYIKTEKQQCPCWGCD